MPAPRGNDSRHYLNFGCSALMVLFGAVLIGGTAVDAAKPSGFDIGDLTMCLFFGVAPLALGILWATRTARARRRAAQEVVERKVLTLALQRGGVISAMEVAAETDLSFDEAKCYLDGLADRGHVEVVPTDHGLAYRFPGAVAQTAPATFCVADAPASSIEPPRPQGGRET